MVKSLLFKKLVYGVKSHANLLLMKGDGWLLMIKMMDDMKMTTDY